MKNLKNNQSQVKNFNQVEITVEGVEGTRKPAFAFFNRVVNLKNVELLVAKMKVKGYREGEKIHVLKAEEAAQDGIQLFDINGNEIPPEDYREYYIVADGQHRTIAVSFYNEYLGKGKEEPIAVPAIEVELKNGESITEYINEINFTKKEWSKEDYLNGAANLHRDIALLQKYNDLIKTTDNPRGFPLSTLNLIYTNSSGLSRNDLILLCSGILEKGTKTKKPIIPSNNIELGDKFIETCRKVGFRNAEIAKRYLIKEFNDIRNSLGDDFAIKVMESITLDDISAMMNYHDHLDEQKVIAHFKFLILKVKKREENDLEDLKIG